MGFIMLKKSCSCMAVAVELFHRGFAVRGRHHGRKFWKQRIWFLLLATDIILCFFKVKYFMCSGRFVELRKICINGFHSSIFHKLPKFFHTFSLTRYILYSFQELRITLSLLLTKKILLCWFKITYVFRGRQVDREPRSRPRSAVAVRRGPSRSKFGPRYYIR